MIIEQQAYARAGLLGNPSDGYFGKTIAISVRNFGAHISLYETPKLEIIPHEVDTMVYKNIFDLVDSINLTGYYGGTRLIKATIKKFFEHCQSNAHRLGKNNFTIVYHTTVPRQVGLAGSSAIITATMRALMKFYNVEIPIEKLPSLILAVEHDELGIQAGLQDRVIQAYEGCVFMDFEQKFVQKHGHGRYERLDPSLLPRIYIAYKTELGKVSGTVLNTVRSRYEQGDAEVKATLEQIAECAQQGRDLLREGDIGGLHELINRNFDLRCKIMPINDENMAMVETARKCGASAKFCGSGGSIIGIYDNDMMLNKLIVNLKKLKARVIKPYTV
jgi:glucuronokinase